MPKKGMFINTQILFRHRDRSTALDFNRLHLEKTNYSYLFFRKKSLKMRDFLKIALGQINAPCPEKIEAATLIRCIKGGECNKKWAPQIISFLEELHVSLIHDIVLSGIFNFEELSNAIDAWGCLDGPTTGWIKEMADLKKDSLQRISILSS
ncbi:MAG: hypothetical protein GY850_28230 [bacterium]|nr:hypothetical protein [bacterium]